MLVLLQGAERVATRLVDHDTYGRQVEHGGGHVMRQVGGQPALPSQERDEVLLVQEGEEEKIEGEEPEEDCDEQDEVAGSFVFVGGDGDPQPGTEHNLQDPDDSQKTLEELQDILPHLRLRRLGWHLSPPPVTLGPFFPDRAGAFCQLQTAGGKDGQKKVEITGVGGRVCGPTMKPKVDKLRFLKKRNSLFFPQPRGFEMKNFLVCFVFSVSSAECRVCVGGLGDGVGAACNSNPAPPLLVWCCWIHPRPLIC